MPGGKAVGEKEKCHVDEQEKQSDESESCLLLLHVVAVFDEDERRLVRSHVYH